MDEPRFLSLAEVLYLHDESLARFAGSGGIRELDLVESAWGSAQNTFWYGGGNLFDIAAAYAFHLAGAQAFLDGNKRTAVAAPTAFLRINGVDFPEDDGSVYAAMIEVADKSQNKAGLAQVLRQLVETKS